MATQDERRTRTRTAILDAARARFVEQGIEATAVADVLADVGISRGALYHHYPSRTELVAAVYERESARVLREAGAAMTDVEDPAERLVAAGLAWLDLVAAPDVTRLLLVDGPAALGWERCRAIEEELSLRAMTAHVAAIADGDGQHDHALVARMVNAVLGEAAIAAVDGHDATVRTSTEAALRALVELVRR